MSASRIPVSRLGLSKSDIVARREYGHDVAPIAAPCAEILGLTGGTVMLERCIRLFVDDGPVLTAMSYLPPELTDPTGTTWHDMAIDELAVTEHPVVPAKYQDSWGRLPAPSERTMLGIPNGAQTPVSLFSRPYHVQTDGGPLSAGLILLVRSDRAYLRWGPRFQGLVLDEQRRRC